MAPPEGHSTNLGAAPCVVLTAEPNALRVAVPVPPGEALWIGLSLPAGIALAWAASGDRVLTMKVIGTGPDGGQFLRSEPFGDQDRAATAEVALRGPDGEARMRVELSSLAAFNARFGFAWSHEPPPTSYGGWRLP